MSYSTQRANILTQTLTRLRSLKPYQLAGHVPNLEFWLSEAEGALAALDGYGARFKNMRTARSRWVTGHGVQVSEYCRYCEGACELGPGPPRVPHRVPTAQIDEARRELRNALRALLLRMYTLDQLDHQAVTAAADRIGTGFEPDELTRDKP